MNRFLNGIHEFCYTLLAFPRAWRFMRNHRLWEGLRQYGWVARSLVVIGVLLVGYAIFEAWDWMDSHAEAPLSAMVMGSESLVWQWLVELYGSMSDGMLNMVTLVLPEVVVRLPHVLLPMAVWAGLVLKETPDRSHDVS